jgi:hypothetical protein
MVTGRPTLFPLTVALTLTFVARRDTTRIGRLPAFRAFAWVLVSTRTDSGLVLPASAADGSSAASVPAAIAPASADRAPQPRDACA